MALRHPDIKSFARTIDSVDTSKLNADPKIWDLSNVRVTGKKPLCSASRLNVDGPLVLNVDVGDDSIIHCQTNIGYKKTTSKWWTFSETNFGLMHGGSLHRTSTKGAEGFAYPGIIDAGDQNIGNNCSLSADRGIYIKNCGKHAQLSTKNGLVHINGDVGEGTIIKNEFGDVYIQGNIAEGVIIHARNIACHGAVANSCQLEAKEDIYLNSAHISPDTRLEGEVLVPRPSRRPIHFGPDAVEKTLIPDHTVGFAHPVGESPEGWVHYTQTRREEGGQINPQETSCLR